MNDPGFRYYLISDRKQCRPGDLQEVIEQACKNGIKAVQLREKDISGKDLYRLATQLREITSEYNTKLFINDRADIAMAVDADGVHCRETSILPRDIKKMDSSLMVGASVHSVESAIKAEHNGADFLLFGPVYHTSSKAQYGSPQGTFRLREVAERVKNPVFAVGGVTPERALQCISAGAHGVAGISSIMASDSVGEKIEEWKESIGAL